MPLCMMMLCPGNALGPCHWSSQRLGLPAYCYDGQQCLFCDDVRVKLAVVDRRAYKDLSCKLTEMMILDEDLFEVALAKVPSCIQRSLRKEIANEYFRTLPPTDSHIAMARMRLLVDAINCLVIDIAAIPRQIK